MANGAKNGAAGLQRLVVIVALALLVIVTLAQLVLTVIGVDYAPDAAFYALVGGVITGLFGGGLLQAAVKRVSTDEENK